MWYMIPSTVYCSLWPQTLSADWQWHYCRSCWSNLLLCRRQVCFTCHHMHTATVYFFISVGGWDLPEPCLLLIHSKTSVCTVQFLPMVTLLWPSHDLSQAMTALETLHSPAMAQTVSTSCLLEECPMLLLALFQCTRWTIVSLAWSVCVCVELV